MKSAEMMNSLKSLLVLAALILPALLINLGDRPIYKIQEVRIAETAREMLASGDWVVPRYNGELRLQKPPLPYWLTAASYRLAGVTEVAARLPAALFGLLSAALLWCWVRREAGMIEATNSVLTVVASYIGLRYFRSGEADAMLMFCIGAACMLGYDIARGRGDSLRRIAFALALGFGFLSKGPAALAIPLLTVAVATVLEKRAGRPAGSARHYLSLPSLAILLAAAFGWYLWITWKFPDISRQFFTRQVDETFISGTHAKPIWWYLAHWPEFFAPWGVLLLPAGWMAFKQRRAMPPLIRFAWIWLAVVFVLLAATVNKQMQYALLFAPPLAIILGDYLANAHGGFARVNRFLFWLFCLASLAGIAVALKKSSDIAHALPWLALPLAPLALQRLLRETAVSIPVLLVAGVTATGYLYGEAYLSPEPHKVAAQSIMSAAAGHSPLYQDSALNDGALSFYAGRIVPPVDSREIFRQLKEHGEIWVIGKEVPDLADAAVEVAATIDDLNLYRLQAKP